MNTSIPRIYVGIDISKAYLDIFLHPMSKEIRLPNTLEGVALLQQELINYEVMQIVCEASGRYECLLNRELQNAGYKVWVVDPKRIRAFIISEGIKAKTDKIDAKMIGLFASKRQPSYTSPLLSDKAERLKPLANLRADLVKIMAMEKNRVKHAQYDDCKRRILAHIHFMEKQIEEIEREMEELIKSEDEWKTTMKIVSSVPGIGKVVATTLIAQMPELGKISNKQIASLLGTAPITKQSGTYKGLAAIQGGRVSVRRVMYMAAVAALNCNPKLKEFYTRLKSAGKKPKVALVAMIRKLIVILNVMVKKGELWTPSFS